MVGGVRNVVQCKLASVYNHWSSAWYIYDILVHISLSGYLFVNWYLDVWVPVGRPIDD